MNCDVHHKGEETNIVRARHSKLLVVNPTNGDDADRCSKSSRAKQTTPTWGDGGVGISGPAGARMGNDTGSRRSDQTKDMRGH